MLYNLTGGVDGGVPNGVMRDDAGNLYGTGETGGAAGKEWCSNWIRPGRRRCCIASPAGRMEASPSVAWPPAIKETSMDCIKRRYVEPGRGL